MLARRVDGISQNLHRGLHRHSKLAQDDIVVALIENARSSILYEKQLLRELESLRNDFNNAAKPAPPSSQPAVAAAPTVRPLTPPQAQSGSWTVPPKVTATPRLQQQQQQKSGQGLPPPPKHTLPHIYTQHAASSATASAIQGPVSSSDVAPSSRSNPLQSTSSSTYATVSAPPSAVAGPGSMASPLGSPGAGPSNVRQYTPTLGGTRAGMGASSSFGNFSSSAQAASSAANNTSFRHVDGTKSMIITSAAGNNNSGGSGSGSGPTHTHTQASSGLGSGQSQIAPASGFDPLLSPGSGLNTSASLSVGAANGSGNGLHAHHPHAHPLAASMMPSSSAGGGQSPLHFDNAQQSSVQASQYGTMRRRLDAREAAAKLANFL